MSNGGEYTNGTAQSPVIQSDHTFKASWRQPEDVDRYLRQKASGKTLNLCCGQSPLGDVQVDADSGHDPDILADMTNLPFPNCTFDSVIFDPPWKLDYFDRQTPLFEAVRVCRPDGLILFNARWVGESNLTEVEEIVVRADDRWANVSVIAVHQKQPGQQTLVTAGDGGNYCTLCPDTNRSGGETGE